MLAYVPCNLCADAEAYKSVAWDRLSESTAPFVTDPSDDAFIWGRSRMSLTEKLDVRGILISNNLFLTTQCGIEREEKEKEIRSISFCVCRYFA